MRCLILVLALAANPTANAETANEWFFLPSVGVGYNSAQGTSMRLGADLGMYFDENIFGGVGAYYAAGTRPEHDRELGAGPFVGYTAPVARFLSLTLREDIDYVDQRTPVKISADTYTHDQNQGVVSQTYAGAHFSVTRNFGFSAGYRLVVGLTKSSLGTGRSGTVLGITIGI